MYEGKISRIDWDQLEDHRRGISAEDKERISGLKITKMKMP